jgi:hypothetical protein
VGEPLGDTRDMAFDPDTGDLFARTNNHVMVARRTGGNAVSGGHRLVVMEDDASVSHQHLAFMNTATDGGLIIFNDRRHEGPNQPFADVVKVARSTVEAVTANFSFLDGYQPAAGAGWYDFDFDADSQTLALLDTSNFQVHIFELGAAATLADGDFDDDGDVDGGDFLTWQRNQGLHGGAATNAQGDADGNQHVNGLDLAVWRGQFGAGGTPAVQALPEPGAAGLIVFAAAVVGKWVRHNLLRGLCKLSQTPR